MILRIDPGGASGEHGIDQNHRIRPLKAVQQPPSRTVQDLKVEDHSVNGRGKAIPNHLLDQTKPPLVSVKGRANPEEADPGGHRSLRWTVRSRKWVAQEMQGS